MPGFNGTGPRGLGPRTGGGRGFCAPAQGNVAYRGRALAGAYGAAYHGLSSKEELELLRNEFSVLQKELEIIESRIKNMEKQKSE